MVFNLNAWFKFRKSIMEYLSAKELADLKIEGLPETRQKIQELAKRQNWQSRPRKGRGGGLEYEVAKLPPEIQAAIRQHQQKQVLSAVALPAIADTLPEKPDLSGSTQAQRNQLGAREAVLNAIETLMKETKVGKDAAITTFLTSAKHPTQAHLLKMLMLATDKRGGGGQVPSARTIKRWFVQRDSNQLMAKVPQKSWQVPDWYPRMLYFFRQPSKPNLTHAYRRFVAEFVAQHPLAPIPSVHTVRRWLEKTGEVEKNKGRMGDRELKNLLPFKRRKFDELMPAQVYSMDGHTFDAEVLHPDSGKPFRPEITTVIDVATRKIVGWSVDLKENTYTVLDALGMAFVGDEVGGGICDILYTDNGKPYWSALMRDECIGFKGRFDFDIFNSLPYSSQARGVIERVHQTVWVQAAKEFQSYIGKDMDAEASQKVHKISRKAMKQEIALKNIPALKNLRSLSSSLIPTWREFVAFGQMWVDEYNNRPHRSLPKSIDKNGKARHRSPNEQWAILLLENPNEADCIIKVEQDEAMMMFLPQEMRKVARGEIQLHNNKYFSYDLQEYHGDTLRVAYSIHNADFVWVFDDDGRFICKAEWGANEIDYFPKTVLEQRKDKRIDAQVKRLETKISVVEAARPAKVLEHQSSVNLGGVVVDLANAKREAEAVLLPRAEPKAEPKVVEKVVEPSWSVPATPQARFDEWQRLSQAAFVPTEAQMWLERYPNSHEFKAMNKQVA